MIKTMRAETIRAALISLAALVMAPAHAYTDLTDFQPPRQYYGPRTENEAHSPAPAFPDITQTITRTEANTMAIETTIKQRLEDYIHQGIFPIIQAKAVSQDKTPEQMRPVAEKVREIMASYGIENLQILQEAGSYPAVYGEIRSPHPQAPTILVQGHYDGQPSDASKWTKVKPHEPKTIPEKGERRIYGRGTSDDWG